MQDIRVFDFDGSVTCQSGLMEQFRSRTQLTDLKGYHTASRLWVSPRKFKRIKEKAFIGVPFFSFLGFGDYYHFSLALIQQHHEPVTIVSFNTHSDWMLSPHQYHCGTWVHALHDFLIWRY
jgi:hypothetical protein